MGRRELGVRDFVKSGLSAKLNYTDLQSIFPPPPHLRVRFHSVSHYRTTCSFTQHEAWFSYVSFHAIHKWTKKKNTYNSLTWTVKLTDTFESHVKYFTFVYETKTKTFFNYVNFESHFVTNSSTAMTANIISLFLQKLFCSTMTMMILMMALTEEIPVYEWAVNRLLILFRKRRPPSYATAQCAYKLFVQGVIFHLGISILDVGTYRVCSPLLSQRGFSHCLDSFKQVFQPYSPLSEFWHKTQDNS
jgi:hypothetical protein